MKDGNWKDFEAELAKIKKFREKERPENIIPVKELNRIQLLKI